LCLDDENRDIKLSLVWKLVKTAICRLSLLADKCIRKLAACGRLD